MTSTSDARGESPATAPGVAAHNRNAQESIPANRAAASGPALEFNQTGEHEIYITSADNGGIAALCRRMVEGGAADGPARVMIDGRHCLTIRSLHDFALTSVAEDPYCRVTAWTPHPRADVGPRVQALLDARAADRRLTREYGRALR